MNLLNTHNHRLVFNIDRDVPEKYITKWNEFKLKCEGGDNKHIIEQIKEYSKLESNKNLPYLERVEGGLGGSNNLNNKQIRFRHIFMGQQLNGLNIPYKKDTSIIFNEIISTDLEKWTYEELDDLIRSFIKTANHYVEKEWVTGYIEIKNKKMFSDNYFE